MRVHPGLRTTGHARRGLTGALTISVTMAFGGHSAAAQGLDCNRLHAQIAQAERGGGDRRGGAVRRQGIELARTQAYAHQLGCDGFSFFGGNPQCSGLNQRIQQLQAGMAQIQAGGGGGRNDLIARYNAYCRSGQAPPQPRGFFESLFGGAEPQRPAALPPPPAPPSEARDADSDDGIRAHGGSQAVCVRACDGGFFPLGLSSHHNGDNLNEMCSALCPGTDAAVYTRSPNAEIKTAVSLDGRPYMELPNALKFSKALTPACSCHPAGKTWAEALANAEEVLGNARKGDIVVTQEKSDELAHQKSEAKAALAPPGAAPTLEATKPQAGIAGSPSIAGPDVTRSVRQVGPQP